MTAYHIQATGADGSGRAENYDVLWLAQEKAFEPARRSPGRNLFSKLGLQHDDDAAW